LPGPGVRPKRGEGGPYASRTPTRIVSCGALCDDRLTLTAAVCIAQTADIPGPRGGGAVLDPLLPAALVFRCSPVSPVARGLFLPIVWVYYRFPPQPRRSRPRDVHVDTGRIPAAKSSRRSPETRDISPTRCALGLAAFVVFSASRGALSPMLADRQASELRILQLSTRLRFEQSNRVPTYWAPTH
jgi:hypothetical protein